MKKKVKQNQKENQYFGKDLEALFFADNYYRWIIKEMRSYIGENLVEVGAGTGTFSRILLKDSPKSLVSIEPSDNMYALLKKNLGNKANTETFKGTFEDVKGKFKTKPDTVFYINVLEHIQDDRKELATVYNSLSEGGYLCIFVPALSRLYGSFDKNVGHFRRYERKELEGKLKDSGFKIEKTKFMDILGIIPWWLMFCVLKRETLKRGQVSLYDKLVIPVLQLFESVFSPPIGKNLLIVGRKVTG